MSVTGFGREFQTVGAARRYARLAKLVLANGRSNSESP